MNASAVPRRAAMRGPLARALVLSALVLAATLALRRFAIEPAEIAHACDPAPWSGACAVRTAIVMTFVDQQLGWLAFGAGVVSTALRGPWLATLALAAGTAGLVLYSFEPAAVGALLGLLVLVRANTVAASTSINTA